MVESVVRGGFIPELMMSFERSLGNAWGDYPFSYLIAKVGADFYWLHRSRVREIIQVKLHDY